MTERIAITESTELHDNTRSHESNEAVTYENWLKRHIHSRLSLSHNVDVFSNHVNGIPNGVFTKKVAVKGEKRRAAVCPNEDQKYFQNLPKSLYFISFTLAYFQISSGHICFITPNDLDLRSPSRWSARIQELYWLRSPLLVEVSSIKFN